MRLLFDHDVSPGLVRSLASLYPASTHVRDIGLHAADDEVVWLRLGNCSTVDIETLLRRHHADLLAFEQDPAGAFLALG